MKIAGAITACLLLAASSLWAAGTAREQAVGSLSGSSASGSLRVEAFAGLPWVTASASGSLSERPSYPALDDTRIGIQRIPFYLQLESAVIPPGERFTAECCLDMSESGMSLGGYTCALSWDTTAVAFLGYAAADVGRFGNPLVNEQRAARGQLVFTEAQAQGQTGLVKLLEVFLQAGELPATARSLIRVQVISLNAAYSYRNLLGLVDNQPAEILITDEDITGTDTTAPQITQTTRYQDTDDTSGPYLITTQVNDENLSRVFLLYKTLTENEYHSIEMSRAGQQFSGSIPGQPEGTVVEYYIRAEDSYLNAAFDPAEYASRPYSFRIGAAAGSCDFNGDGRITVSDVIALLIFQKDNPGDLGADFNGDGKSTITDAIAMLLAMRDGTCPDVSAVLSSAAGVTLIEGLTAVEIACLEKAMAGLGLTAREEADFRLAIYGEAGAASLPKAFSLAQNSPNPFNPATTIGFSLPEGFAGKVSLKVFDLRGSLVRVLVDEAGQSGSFTVFWDGTDYRGRSLPSGIYLYRLQTDDFVQTRKMVLLK
ncbi:MAG: T9SS type A sorting domain-containing protein [Candidatus Glassbacteria bacterium]|nr:T9SS type A sorting domain-containing protein [Candidatus Glassbacteria bacterium]